jgi:glycosyltransferase involved in cell wall biosynthesis
VTRPRLLVVGQGLRPAGYARVMEAVLPRLAAAGAVDPVLFAVNQAAADGGRSPPRGLDVRLNGRLGDPYGREQLGPLLRELRPDVVVVHNDAAHYSIHRRAIEEYGRARVVVYCPVDWELLPPSVPTSLVAVDTVVTYTGFGDRVLERAFARAGLVSPPRTTIAHGVDGRVFRALGSRAGARRRLFPDRPELRDAFLVLNANRNIRRKRVDLTLRGFARFARSRPDAYLYLHMGMTDRGCDVPALAAELGIAGRVLATTRERDRPDVPDERLNLIYNACDVGLNTCEAEGWGLVAFEHAAAGAAQVVPDGGACAELWHARALLVPAAATDRGGHLVSAAGVADALGRLYDDRALLADLAARGQAHARSPALGWDAIAADWERVVLEHAGERPIA